MRDKFTITISDVNGSKHYLLKQVIKKFILYVVLFIVLLFLGGSFFISFLMQEVKNQELKKERLIEEYKISKTKLLDEFARIKEESLKLKKDNQKLKQQIEAKAKEYEAIQEKVNNIEELVGLKPTENTSDSLGDRLDKISFTGRQQQIIFRNIPNGPPVPYKGYSGKFGWRIHPILKRKEFHRGLDMRAEMKTPIKAPADGVVEYAGFHKRSGFGYLIILDHNYGFKTSYGHLYKKMVVKAGQFVKKGDIIGYVGTSGLSTGPHLHYEVRFVSRALNPYYFVKWNSSNFKEIFKKEKRVAWESLIKMINTQYQLQKQQSFQTEQK